MADFWYNIAKNKLAKGDLDFDVADLRVKLCMSNTTCDTEVDAANLAGFTTIDAYDGTGYTDLDLAGVSVVNDTTNDRTEVQYSAGNFGATVGAGTRQWVGALYYVRVDGTAANDYPVAWKDLTANNGNGGQINFTPNAEGLLQIA